jgi:sugar lactone lactonase YvrE
MTEESYTDEADVSQLETRIDELEATIRKMLPSRREAIGMGVAGLAGASLMSGTASAGSAQVGTIGDNSNLVDLVAEDVTITDTLNTASLASAPAGEALLSDGNGNLQFGAAGGVEEVSTFSNLPAIDTPQLAFVVDEDQYYHSNDTAGLFDISNASFSTSINAQDGTPTGIAWNDDGSRLYEVGESSQAIYQYTVSTPFDITSASFSTDIPTQGSGPSGIAWNNDGSRLYEVDDFPDFEIYQFNVSTPYDITTASFSTSINTQDGEPRGIAWNDDGTRLYEVGKGSDKIYQSTVSTPFDITSASFSTDIPTQDSDPTGIAWNNDGSRLYEVGFNSVNIYQSNVSTGGWVEF